MKYDIYFHNDFDGRASAAVVLAFLRSRGDSIEHFTAIDFDLQHQWEDERFFIKHKLFKGKRNPVIVVDFLYHPGAAFWFDHHPTTFKKIEWQKHFTPSKFHVLDASYPSCCHLVYASLKKNFGWKPPRHFAELVKWLDIIDGAHYASAKQTLLLKEPALEVDAWIDEKKDNKIMAKWMIERLSMESLRHIAKTPEVQKTARLVRQKNQQALIFYKKNMKALGNATFIDLSGTSIETLRFAAYYLYPKIRYGVRLTKKGKLYHIGIGSNPWMRSPDKIHIGLLLQKYGGGGHKGAGGAAFKTKNDALRAVPELLQFLNK